MAVKPIPDNYPRIIPIIAVHDGDAAIDYYKRVFGAEERMRFSDDAGKLMHCELALGDSVIMIGPPMGGSTQSLSAVLYVDDCDAVFARAVEAGGTAKQEPEQQFWGDRGGRVIDPFGNEWFIASQVEDVSMDELRRRFRELQDKVKEAAE